MPTYDPDFSDRSAPLAFVTLRDPGSRKNVTNVSMLLDTGADSTLIPRLAVTALGVAETSAVGLRLVGFDGSSHVPMKAFVEIGFLNKTFRGEFAVTDAPYGFIGRDILNFLRLVFDGPRLIWEEAPPVR